MKKVLLVIVLLLIATAVKAEVIRPNIPELRIKEGIIYSIKNDKVENVTAVSLYEYKTPVGSIGLDGGYVIENEPIVALCYTSPTLSELGVNLPYTQYVSVSGGGYLGVEFNQYERNGEDDNHFSDALDYGLYAVGQLKVQF